MDVSSISYRDTTAHDNVMTEVSLLAVPIGWLLAPTSGLIMCVCVRERGTFVEVRKPELPFIYQSSTCLVTCVLVAG